MIFDSCDWAAAILWINIAHTTTTKTNQDSNIQNKAKHNNNDLNKQKIESESRRCDNVGSAGNVCHLCGLGVLM